MSWKKHWQVKLFLAEPFSSDDCPRYQSLKIALSRFLPLWQDSRLEDEGRCLLLTFYCKEDFNLAEKDLRLILDRRNGLFDLVRKSLGCSQVAPNLWKTLELEEAAFSKPVPRESRSSI